jgi:hypothetical protein
MKKWIIRILLLQLALMGVLAALPVALPIWQEYRPHPVVHVDAAMRRQVIDSLITQTGEHYLFPEKTKPIELLLRQRLRNGDYDGIADGETLAKALTADLAAITHDLHMAVGFSPEVLPPELERHPGRRRRPAQSGPFFMKWIDAFGRHMATFGVENVEQLPSNIGYFQLTAFFHPELSGPKYGAAMDRLADTGALIIDLRHNSGGSRDAVALLASYFVDGRTRLTDIDSRDTDLIEQRWTQDTLAGKRYGAQRKIALLVGPDTHSAGEEFAYTMQAMKRATVIGARTWGGAHPAGVYRLGDHFVSRIPDARSISPITGTNWEGGGVIPDIAAAPKDALSVATVHLLSGAQHAGGVRVAVPTL